MSQDSPRDTSGSGETDGPATSDADAAGRPDADSAASSEPEPVEPDESSTPDETDSGRRRGRFGGLGPLSTENRVGRAQRRREKIRAEIERNRRGEYKVPTWVLVVALIAIVAGWVALIVFA